jgi:hypothetical protein
VAATPAEQSAVQSFVGRGDGSGDGKTVGAEGATVGSGAGTWDGAHEGGGSGSGVGNGLSAQQRTFLVKAVPLHSVVDPPYAAPLATIHKSVPQTVLVQTIAVS